MKPFSALEWRIAWRYVRARRQDGFISVIAGFSFLGILLGVATLIVVMSVMNGFRSELLGRILGVNGHMAVYGKSRPITDYDTLVNQIRTIPGVKAAHPLVERQALVMSGTLARGALVHGLTPEALRTRPLISQKIVAGDLGDFGPPDTALIGSRLAEKMHLDIGDTLTLLAPEGTQTAMGTVPRFRRFKVVAFFDVGMNEYDNTFIFIPLESAQKFFHLFPAVSGFEIFLTNPENMGPPLRVLNAMVGPRDLRVFDWQQANASFFSVVEVERNVMFLILMLIVIVAAFNVVSSLIMLVKDKARDIAILRTMGATQGMIRRIFILTGGSVGLAGTAIGTTLGLFIASHLESVRKVLEKLTGAHLFPAEFYFLSKLPSRIDPPEVALVVVLTLVLTFLATLYPSWRAARLNPVEALRYE
jgi:lipoprotein-releasing system permease protein